MSTNDLEITALENLVLQAAKGTRIAVAKNATFDVQEAMENAVSLGTTGHKAWDERKQARDDMEVASIRNWLNTYPQSTVEVVNNRPVQFKLVELVYRPVNSLIGLVAGYNEMPPGTIATSLNERMAIRPDVLEKHCVAQYMVEEGVPLTDHVIIIRIPGFRLDGERVLPEEREQMIRAWLKAHHRTMCWTQSSIKPGGVDGALSLYTLPNKVWNKVVQGMDLREAANYMPLIFSECDTRPGYRITMGVTEPLDGHDGNVIVNTIFSHRACQFRAVEADGYHLLAVAKGTMTPVLSGGEPAFDLNQVKFGGPGRHTFTILRNNGVEAVDVERKVYASAMLGMNMAYTSEVEAWAVKNVKTQVAELLDLMRPERRGDLLCRWGGLNFDHFVLTTAKNTAVDMLRSNVPYSQEMSELLGRVCLTEIVEGIVPSLGVQGWSSLLFQSTKYGEPACPLDKAQFVFFGQPCLSTADFFPMEKSPFKRNMGHVVAPEVAEAGGRDSDGDQAIRVGGKNAKVVLEHLLKGIDPAFKPDKSKRTGVADWRSMFVLGCEIIQQSWIVGSATQNYWKAVQEMGIARRQHHNIEAERWARVAGRFAWAAKTAPMLSKHQIMVENQAYMNWFLGFHGAYKEELGHVHLAWKEAQNKSKSWKTPRDMAKAMIANPRNIVDVAWNAAVEVVQAWVQENPSHPFSATELTDLAFERIDNGEIPSWAMAEAREMANTWNGYWNTPEFERGGRVSDRAMREKTITFFRKADPIVVTAALTLRTKAGGAMWGFKVNAAKAGRMTEVLGLHPSVAKLVEERWPDIAASAEFAQLTANTQ